MPILNCQIINKLDLIFRVSQLSDIELISRETDCLPSYIRKGIAMSSFYYARCLHEGHGAKKDELEAKKFYSRVSIDAIQTQFLINSIKT